MRAGSAIAPVIIHVVIRSVVDLVKPVPVHVLVIVVPLFVVNLLLQRLLSQIFLV